MRLMRVGRRRDEILSQFFAKLGARTTWHARTGRLAITPYSPIQTVIMIIDLAKNLFDFHQGLDVTLLHSCVDLFAREPLE